METVVCVGPIYVYLLNDAEQTEFHSASQTTVLSIPYTDNPQYERLVGVQQAEQLQTSGRYNEIALTTHNKIYPGERITLPRV